MTTNDNKEKEWALLMERWFGYRSFLDGQIEIIQAIMKQSDCIGILPTGGGKSLCYQLPAIIRGGITLVISPLIALMKDQVDGLQQRRIKATFINSTLDSFEQQKRLSNLACGTYRLVYVAPERFRDKRFVSALSRTEVSMVAVDEAHCISMWGHDFRPDYRHFKTILAQMQTPQVLALTATATPQVRYDIASQLGLDKAGRNPPKVIVRGFARNNLSLAVRRVASHQEKLTRTLEILSIHHTAIIYCSTRKSAQRTADKLHARGIHLICYHAGLDDHTRSQLQKRFLSGQVPVAVATNAFGMGISRIDVRAVVHWDVPGSLEAYYQEAGRAGRDQKPGHCEILFNYADVRTQEYFFCDNTRPAQEQNLRWLLRYIDTRTCRHAFILRHFDDQGYETICQDRCDNCVKKPAHKKRSLTVEECDQVRIVLNCIASLQGGYGRARIGQMLVGSKDKNLLATGLQHHRFYGALHKESLRHIRILLDALEEQEFIRTVGIDYPCLHLTTAGWRILRERTSIQLPLAHKNHRIQCSKSPDLRYHPKLGKIPSIANQLENQTPVLTSALQTLRTQLAKHRRVPAYVIFSNATLEAICQHMPQDQKQLLAIHGMGPKRVNDFGEAILSVVRWSSKASQHDNTPPPTTDKISSTLQPPRKTLNG